MRQLHPIMLAGTGSDVGKSVVATALCRIFRQDGYCPAPFKAQNMSLNSYATPDGLEIGRAQAVQAEAAGIDCSTNMNPQLLKPNSNHTSQLVLNGKVVGDKTAYDCFRSEPLRNRLRREVCSAFDRLSSRYNPIVMEGAGSVSEINLMGTDIVNMPMAEYANADVVVVGDIDRGGVFASLYGSIMLQTEKHRQLIKGVIVNKFRGDLHLFQKGRSMLEKICGVPVLGVIPYYDDIYIDEEDSVSLSRKATRAEADRVRVAVVMLRHISNFTDFDALERDARVHLYYATTAADIAEADIVILPGTKTTISDLVELRRSGMAKAVVDAWADGRATVVGICGGYQMMGRVESDPYHVESDIETMAGLSLLPVSTVMTNVKAIHRCHFTTGFSPEVMEGYEIHCGLTTADDIASWKPLVTKDDGVTDGCMVDRRCLGTYIHGVFDNAAFVDWLLQPYLSLGSSTLGRERILHSDFKQRQYDKLADHVRKHIDMELLYYILSR